MGLLISRGEIILPQGFLGSGVHAGIKEGGKLDLALLFSSSPARAAAMLTTNKIKAWPVLYSLKVIKNRTHRAILANSGNANCFNGRKGKKLVSESVRLLSKRLGIAKEEILVASTGLIGLEAPGREISRAIPNLVNSLSKRGGEKVARAVLTTDVSSKTVSASFKVGPNQVRIAGLAKGAGMIHPRLATMLCFLLTDLNITKLLLKRALREAVKDSFNRISVDNDMSTNDSIFILANGQAGNQKITSLDGNYHLFLKTLKTTCLYLAQEIVRGGEGVKKFCEIRISGASKKGQAERVARQIADSMLFKTMLAGADPNWGRVLAAIGAARVPVRANRLDIAFNKVKILNQGQVIKKNKRKLRPALRKKDILLEVNLREGQEETSLFTCDLTKQYVQINSEYTT